jgi:uncharacterized membrane protein
MMDQTHIHLIITHLPIFGSVLGAFVLTHGIWTKNKMTLIAAYNVLIISAFGAGIAYGTGEGAEETVEHIQGVSKHLIEEHSESAIISLIALIIVGLISLIGLFVTLRSSAFIKPVALTTLLLSLIAFGFIARTGYLGGQIRHTEIDTNAVTPIDKSGNGKDND